MEAYYLNDYRKVVNWHNRNNSGHAIHESRVAAS
jgi:hypothetical protein